MMPGANGAATRAFTLALASSVAVSLALVAALAPRAAAQDGEPPLCRAGLVVAAEASCRYPGVGDRDYPFAVDRSGRALFLFLSDATAITVPGWRIDGRRVWFAAHAQADGSWLVTSAGVPPEGAGPTSDAVVVLADGWSAADVAVASVLSAATEGSVVLYTHRERLPEESREVLGDVLPRKVVVLGGPAAVGADVIAAIRGSTGLSGVERIAGADRYATAAQAARSVLGEPGGDAVTVVLANGHSPADIGTAAAVAARTANAAVLYTAAGELPDAAAAVLREYRPARAVIVGGPAAVPAAVVAAVREAASGVEVVRVAGGTRFATAAAAAQHLLGDPRSDRDLAVVVANGHSPADIGAAVALATRTANSVVLYTAADQISGPTARTLSLYRPTRIVIVGGHAAVSDEAEHEIAQAAPDAGIERFSGRTRTHTAAVIARHILQTP
ncbi:MAG: hypothetical protein F4Z53_08700 [Acidimicrobiales bacterium]|nr:hypothetical protein [Acidimicrobiales bacterium]MYD33276.1 hypothetical protein [Acidimicrobiales bacterium]MYI10565.1 hypothetical protein [Acidimicrobiales bacterium]